MTKITQAILLCGGRGERLKPLTDTVPKPMTEVCGRPFVSYLIEILRNMKVEDIVLSIGYLSGNFAPLNGLVRLVESKPVVNQSILSTPDLQNRFIVANGDCLPVLRWKDFLKTEGTAVAVKHGGSKDVGVCIVTREQVMTNYVNCGNMRSMIGKLDPFVAYSNFSIDTPEKLKLTREIMSWWWQPNEKY